MSSAFVWSLLHCLVVLCFPGHFWMASVRDIARDSIAPAVDIIPPLYACEPHTRPHINCWLRLSSRIIQESSQAGRLGRSLLPRSSWLPNCLLWLVSLSPRSLGLSVLYASLEPALCSSIRGNFPETQQSACLAQVSSKPFRATQIGTDLLQSG